MSEEVKKDAPVEEKPAQEAPTEENKDSEEAKPQNPSEKKEKKEKSKARKIIEWVVTGLFAGIFVVAGVFLIDGMIHKSENNDFNISFGFGTFVIMTDSMEPEYKINTAIVTHKDDLEDIYQAYLDQKPIDITFADKVRYTTYLPTLGGITQWDTEVPPSQQTNPTDWAMTHRLREIQIDDTKEVGQGHYIFFASGTNKGAYLAEFGQYQTFTEKELLGVVKLNSPVLGGFLWFVGTPWGLLVLLLIPAGYLVVTSVLDIFKAVKEPEEAGTNGAKTPNSGAQAGSNSLDGFSEEEKKKLKEELLKEMMKKKGDK